MDIIMSDNKLTRMAAVFTTVAMEGMLLGVAGLTYGLMYTQFFKTVVTIIWLLGSLVIAFAGGRMYGRIELKRDELGEIIREVEKG